LHRLSGYYLLDPGLPDQTLRQAEQLAELLRQPLPANAYAIGIFHLLTTHCDFLGDYRGARAQAEEALDRAIKNGNPWGIFSLTLWLGRIMVAEGAVDAGIEKLREIHSAEVAVDPHLAD
jgi:hypothetical protein